MTCTPFPSCPVIWYFFNTEDLARLFRAVEGIPFCPAPRLERECMGDCCSWQMDRGWRCSKHFPCAPVLRQRGWQSRNFGCAIAFADKSESSLVGSSNNRWWRRPSLAHERTERRKVSAGSQLGCAPSALSLVSPHSSLFVLQPSVC